MSKARTEIFARLKSVLDLKQDRIVRTQNAEQRIRAATPNLIPARGRAEGLTRAIIFEEEAKFAQAEVRKLVNLKAVPDIVRDICQEAQTTALKIAPHPELQVLEWQGLNVEFGPGAGSDLVGLSRAYAGVAETGTLVMVSGPASPSTLNFLPDVHIVVIHTEDIVANYEQVWSRLRQDAGGDTPVMPRTVNWITGPSRTADIEQTLLLGAHGPRKLIILLIDAKNP
ncbi:LutC/YkgG family protein [Magnetovibrio blakemorei]|uniref:LUD domain-containing protein n=1 Tax=Magnetovibrio blakemorei TaxID=28181 RepID=A0A1E5Q3Q1_9PROT|nr:lactate utilization protein [Magnetovibrio blakemorei]OEJ64412.1 hypothetical protein BEN30_16515 [Magnetovibrio blakemorei]